MNNNYVPDGTKTTNNAGARNNNQAFQKATDHLVNVLMRKHQKLDRKLVE